MPSRLTVPLVRVLRKGQHRVLLRHSDVVLRGLWTLHHRKLDTRLSEFERRLQ